MITTEAIVALSHRLLAHPGYKTTLFQDRAETLDPFKKTPMQFDLINETRAREIGIKEYLKKPVKAETFTTTNRSILDS